MLFTVLLFKAQLAQHFQPDAHQEVTKGIKAFTLLYCINVLIASMLAVVTRLSRETSNTLL